MSEIILKPQGAKATGEDWRDNWITPDYILEIINLFFDSTLDSIWFDPCPVDPTFDGLSMDWKDRNCYINPPFSQYGLKDKSGWAYKSNKGSEHLWMCNHSHDVVWFKHLMSNSTAICLLDKRVAFVDPRTMLPSENTAIGKCQTILYTGSHIEEFTNWFSNLGKVVLL